MGGVDRNGFVVLEFQFVCCVASFIGADRVNGVLGFKMKLSFDGTGIDREPQQELLITLTERFRIIYFSHKTQLNDVF